MFWAVLDDPKKFEVTRVRKSTQRGKKPETESKNGKQKSQKGSESKKKDLPVSKTVSICSVYENSQKY